MLAFASSLDIDLLDAKHFFAMLSDRGRRPVDIDTFVVGCVKLKGGAKALDVMGMVLTLRDEIIIQRQFQRMCSLQFDRLHLAVSEIAATRKVTRGWNDEEVASI